MNRNLGTAEGKLSRFGRVGATALAGFGVAAGGAAFIGIRKSVTAAADLGEEINKASVIFGRSKKDILDWSRTSSTAFGLSRREALEAAGNFGGFFKVAGEGAGQAAKLSKQMVQLAGDMSSFNNSSPEDTLQALRSGLSGESEPLRRFRVFLTEAKVEQEAWSSGIAKSGEKLTEGQKIMARYNIILRETRDAHGDYKRTADALPNLQRTINAQFEDSSATIGRVFLPALARGGKALSGFLKDNQPELKRFARGFERAASDAVQGLVRGFRQRRRQGMSAGEALADMVADGFAKGTSAVLNAAARMAPKAVGAFLKGWWEADGWAKLLTLGFLMRKVGVGPFRGFGKAGGNAAAGAAGAGIAGGLGGKKFAGRMDKVGKVAGRAFGVAFGAVAFVEVMGALNKIADEEGISDSKLGSHGATTGTMRGPIGLGKRLGQKLASSLGIGNSGSGRGMGSRAGATGTTTRPGGGVGNAGMGGGGGRIAGYVKSGGGSRAIASAVVNATGLKVSSGWRSVAHNRSVGGVSGSYHTRGNSQNPGAWDFVGSSEQMQDGLTWARQNVAGLAEAMIHDVGSGLHLHLAFTPNARVKSGAGRGGGGGSFPVATGGAGESRKRSRPKLSRSQRIVMRAAQAAGIDPAILYGIWGAESNFAKGAGPVNPNSGAAGAFQFMPATAKGLGINPRNFKQAAFGAARYFKQLLDMFGGDVQLAIAAYNAGPGNVKKHGGIPPFAETKAYVPKVLRHAKGFPDDDFSPLGVDRMSPGEMREWRRETAERLARRRMRPVLNRLRGWNRGAARIGSLAAAGVSATERRLGLRERRNDLDEEDLTTPEGRAERVGELEGVRTLQQVNVMQLTAGKRSLQRRVKNHERAIRRLRSQLKRAPRGQKGVIRGQIRKLRAKIKDLRDEAREMGWDISSANMDVAETDRDIGAAGRGESGEEADAPTVGDQISEGMEWIDLQERAGDLSPAAARQARIDAINWTLAGGLGPLDERTTLQLRGDLRELMDQNTEALNASTEAVNALKDEVKRQNEIAQSTLGIQTREIARALADMIGGQIVGHGLVPRSHLPSSGNVAAY